MAKKEFMNGICLVYNDITDRRGANIDSRRLERKGTKQFLRNFKKLNKNKNTLSKNSEKVVHNGLYILFSDMKIKNIYSSSGNFLNMQEIIYQVTLRELM